MKELFSSLNQPDQKLLYDSYVSKNIKLQKLLDSDIEIQKIDNLLKLKPIKSIKHEIIPSSHGQFGSCDLTFQCENKYGISGVRILHKGDLFELSLMDKTFSHIIDNIEELSYIVVYQYDLNETHRVLMRIMNDLNT